VKSGYYVYFNVSSERTNVDGPPPDDGPKPRLLVVGQEGEDEELPTLKATLPKRRRQGKSRNTDTQAEKDRKTREQTRTVQRRAGTYPPSERAVRARIDYPYEESEFTAPSMRIKLCTEEPEKDAKRDDAREAKDAIESTLWVEETDGRRERDANMFDIPASPVYSPLHSPIDPDDAPKKKTKTSVPGAYPDADVNVLEPRQQQRCGHKPERCRAWWTHVSDEC
jgi:hypothetical protein